MFVRARLLVASLMGGSLLLAILCLGLGQAQAQAQAGQRALEVVGDAARA